MLLLAVVHGPDGQTRGIAADSVAEFDRRVYDAMREVVEPALVASGPQQGNAGTAPLDARAAAAGWGRLMAEVDGLWVFTAQIPDGSVVEAMASGARFVGIIPGTLQTPAFGLAGSSPRDLEERLGHALLAAVDDRRLRVDADAVTALRTARSRAQRHDAFEDVLSEMGADFWVGALTTTPR